MQNCAGSESSHRHETIEGHAQAETVTDLTSALDAAGTLHAAFVSSGDRPQRDRRIQVIGKAEP